MKRVLLVLAVLPLALGCLLPPCGLLERYECESAGGRWGTVGLNPDEVCNMPTSDAGKECLSSAECEGDCIARLTDDEMEQVMGGQPVEHTGECSAWKLTVGCLAYVEDGRVDAIACVD